MIYLGENYCGFDAEGLGFPSIDSCHAVVVQTEKGLFGYHNYGGSGQAQFAPRAAAFAQYVQGHAEFGTCVKLYGVCFRSKRGYASGAAWPEEMRAFASALGYTGDILGWDLGKDKKLGADSAYVEYRLKSGKVTAEYKRHNKTEAGESFAVKGADLKYIKPGGSGYQLVDKDKSTTPWTVKVTKSNKGEMHAIELEKLK